MKKNKLYLFAVLVLAWYVSACSTDVAIQKLLGTSSEGPVFTGYRATGPGFEFAFSEPVKVLSLVFDPHQEVTSIEEGALVKVQVQHSLGVGAGVVADLLVEDLEGNTLNVLVPVRTRNNRIPGILINEIRTEYANPKTEFIELRTTGPGNLGALRVYAAGISLDEPVYEFPPCEVKTGEYIVLHLRTLDPASTDETGSSLGLSPGTEALTTARDFWAPGTAKLIRKTDTVFITDQDGQILDAVMMSETADSWWLKERFAHTAELLGKNTSWAAGSAEQGAFPGPVDAVASQYNTTTRTVCRNEQGPDTNTSADWYTAATGNATPGAPNSRKKHVP